MKKPFITSTPVTLDGYQAILKPSKFGYSLKANIPAALVEELEVDRVESLKWAESKLKNPKRATLKPEPWEELDNGDFTAKFSWNEDNKPPVVDAEGTPITDTNTPIYSGSLVKLAFNQRPYILKDGVTYGTSLKLVGIQAIKVAGNGGFDSGTLDADAVADLFGVTAGYVANEPAPSQDVGDEDGDEDDIPF